MSTNYLLIDFGTTSTKSAQVDLSTGHFTNLQRHPAIPPDPTTPTTHHEIPLETIYSRFDQICRTQWDHTSYSGILLCSEMHGFTVLSKQGLPLSPYVSWLDARSLDPVDGTSIYDVLVEKLGPRFKAITGMKPRSGFPLMNLAHLAHQREDLGESGFILSLPGWLAVAAERARGVDFAGPPPEHPTLLAGMALYDVEAAIAAPELADAVESLSGFRPELGRVGSSSTIAGHWQSPTATVPIYAGVGDHQCSVLGAAVAPHAMANLNLGTGSQVGVIDRRPADPDVETRPYFDGSRLYAITHIPAGRALAEYVDFLATVSDRTADEFWERLASLDAAACARASLTFDLSIFEGARHFIGGGSIAGIVEGSLTPDNYLASLLRSFVGQYVEALTIAAGDERLDRCVLSGGIARNLPHLADLLSTRCRESGLALEVAPAAALDESLLGLRSLALIAAGAAATYREAQKRFGRDAVVAGG